MSIYLDHCATTKPYPVVIECLKNLLQECYANPSSMHSLGLAAEKSLAISLHRISEILGCQKEELILTSGGSESINLAIKGFMSANPRLGKRIITSSGEHAATFESLKFLGQQGYQVEEIPLKPDGQIDLDALAKALLQPAALISLIHVSNESGAVNPVAEIVRLRNLHQPGTAIHLDAVQSLGRQTVDFHKMGVDLLSGSGHKVGAPKGIGWLLVRRGIRLTPQIHGGGQQRGLRSGTENPPLAAALALAVEQTSSDLPAKTIYITGLRKDLLSKLDLTAVRYYLISPEDAVPQIITIAFPGLRGETLLHALEAKGIYVSTGAACGTKKQKTNPVLKAMGIPDKISFCSIRVSLADSNTPDEITDFVQAIAESCQTLIP